MDQQRRQWRNAIVKALRDKGFTKKGARKTAAITIQKSLQKKEERRASAQMRNYNTKIVVIDGQSVEVKVYPPSE